MKFNLMLETVEDFTVALKSGMRRSLPVYDVTMMNDLTTNRSDALIKRKLDAYETKRNIK